MPQNFNNCQQEAINHKDGPLLIAAGAGSGKTQTLTSRLATLIKSGINPENIIAITFTNKAASEMSNRVKSQMLNVNGLFIGTFHSLGARILKKEARLLKRSGAFTIYDADDSLTLIKKIIKDAGINKENCQPLAVQDKISAVKSELLDPEELLDKTELKIFEDYEATLEKNNAFDFDDLIEKVVTVFQKHPAVLEKYQHQFRYILVDEYQDVNTAQYQFVKLLAAKHQNISVVGDDQQAIYSFRGADFRNFLNFEKDWPKAKVVLLEQNYRSSGNIIAAASEVIKNNKFQKPKTLWTENSSGEPIKIVRTTDAESEAVFIVNQLTPQLINSSTAILYRTNAQSRAIEQALIFANIPYQIFGGLKFYERKEIKDLVAALRLAANPKDAVSAERLFKNFHKKTADYLIAELPRLGKELKIIELINFFIANADYFEYLEKNFKNYSERLENINELIAFASEFNDLGEFLERVSLLQSTDKPTDRSNVKTQMSNVNLMSIHLAKGLEFDRVLVVGCNEGILPHQKSYGTLEALEEERRLMYVAMTRAKKQLCLSCYGIPSRFLYEIPGHLTEFIDLGKGKNSLPDDEEIYIDDF